MTGKRFTIGDRALQEVYGGCIPAILDGGIPCTQSEVLKLLNELHEEKEQLLSDKEHLMGCLIRFFGYDDEDIDYNLNRESNREYGKQYYSMKEETKKEL